MKEMQVTMRQAIEELRIAENLFNNAATDKQIDRAVHLINAANTRIEIIREGELN